MYSLQRAGRKTEIETEVWPFFALSTLIIISDQLLKLIVFNKLSLGTSLPLIKDILHITPVYNTGIAFGLLKNFNIIIPITVSVAAIILILYIFIYKRPSSPILLTAISLILSGAIGNLIDRLAYGCVLDFIDLRLWPVFNISDSAITIGTVIIILYLLTRRKT